MVAGGVLFETFFSGLYDLVESCDVDGSELPAQVALDDPVELAQDLPQL